MQRNDELEHRVHQLELNVTNHIATCNERGKRIEGTLTDIKEQLKAEAEPKTLYGFALRFLGRYGLGSAAMLLLGFVLWWSHDERTATKQEQTKKLEKIVRALKVSDAQ